MIVSIIVAASSNNVIGKDNDLIWHLPVDMNFFKTKTNSPLPNRTNIIITRKEDYIAENCLVKHNLIDAINHAKKNKENEAFIIGGGELYKLALEQNLVDRIYLTRVHHDFEGDTFFPSISNQWKEIDREEYEQDEKHKYNFTFLTYEKEIKK
jgi:dihydrofolate reductase